MKYQRLTKEQFDSLHKEFAKFLASQQIDATEWTILKKEQPDLAEEELNIFSDMVWDDVLNKVQYLEHYSKQHINLFKCEEKIISRIVVSVERPNFDFFKDEDFKWFIDHTQDKTIQFFKGKKEYQGERNSEIFDLIQKGGQIGKGALYEQLKKLIKA